MNPLILQNVGVIKDVLTIVALILGSLWAAYKFLITQPLKHRLDISLTLEQLPPNPNDYSGVVVLKVTLHNIGPVKVTPGTKGLQVSVGEIPITDQHRSAVVESRICKPVREDFDALARYKDSDSQSYVEAGFSIFPGVSYYEPIAIQLERNKMYAFKVKWCAQDSRYDMVNYIYGKCA